MRYLAVLTLLMAILLSACPQPTAGPTPTQAPVATAAATATPVPAATPDGTVSDPVITYERSGGIAGKIEKWTVYPSGRVEGPGAAGSKTVPADRVATVLREIKASGFWALDNAYGAGSPCRDCYNVVLTVREDDMLKQVSAVLEASDTPAALKESVAKVDDLVAGK